MALRVSTPIKGAAVTALAVGIGASAIVPANSAPAPRVTASQCSTVANNSGGTGYVIVDTTTNTSCVVKANGTFVWSSKANVCLRKPVKFKGSLLPITNRGDVAFKVKVRYIRGNKVIKKTMTPKNIAKHKDEIMASLEAMRKAGQMSDDQYRLAKARFGLK